MSPTSDAQVKALPWPNRSQDQETEEVMRKLQRRFQNMLVNAANLFPRGRGKGGPASASSALATAADEAVQKEGLWHAADDVQASTVQGVSSNSLRNPRNPSQRQNPGRGWSTAKMTQEYLKAKALGLENFSVLAT